MYIKRLIYNNFHSLLMIYWFCDLLYVLIQYLLFIIFVVYFTLLLTSTHTELYWIQIQWAQLQCNKETYILNLEYLQIAGVDYLYFVQKNTLDWQQRSLHIETYNESFSTRVIVKEHCSYTVRNAHYTG